MQDQNLRLMMKKIQTLTHLIVIMPLPLDLLTSETIRTLH